MLPNRFDLLIEQHYQCLVTPPQPDEEGDTLSFCPLETLRQIKTGTRSFCDNPRHFFGAAS